MLNEFIDQLSEEFSREALSSPSLIEDMASMERYLAESYNDRAFIELLQNADDANSRRVKVLWSSGNLIVANDGRPFTESDIVAISRSGASAKKRGQSIGYRGVGFKSTTCFSDYIVISSSDCLFSFSKQLTAKRIGMPIDKVPTVRIPINVSDDIFDSSTNEVISKLHHDRYRTVFIFCNSNMNKCITELQGITMGTMLFLQNICQFAVDPKLTGIVLDIERKPQSNGFEVEITNTTKKYSRKWRVKNDEHIAIACQENSAERSDDVFHCFLPTLDSTGFGFRINGDFTTDPSRKHIVMDAHTQAELDRVGLFISRLIREDYSSNKSITGHIVTGYANQTSSNQFSATLDLIVKRELRNSQWICTITNKQLRPDDCVLLPQWYTESIDKILIDRMQFDLCERFVGSSNANLRKVYIKLGVSAAKPDVFCDLLSDEQAIMQLPEKITLAIMIDVIKDFRIKNSSNVFTISSSWYVRINREIYQICKIKENDSLSEQFYSILVEQGNNSADIAWFCERIGISKASITDVKENGIKSSSYKPEHKDVMPRWRAAEEICVEIEKRLGNRASDVSKQNLGYDVLSEEMNGKKRYIEVKSVNRIGDVITLTNNEYSSANQYGDQYIICIISQESASTHVVYIRNPLNNARLEKRVKIWEWALDNYSGEQFTV